MAKGKRHIFGTRKLIGITLIAVLLTFGFCPLRNTLFAVVFQSKAPVPKTTGTRLLNAHVVCKTAVANSAITVSEYQPLPRNAGPVVIKMYLFVVGGRLRLQSRLRSYKIPIYAVNQVWRI